MKNITVQPCDFRIHDMIDDKFKVERVLSSTFIDQKFKVNDTSGREYILELLKLWDVEPFMRQNILLSAEREIKSCMIKSNYLTTIVQDGMVNGNPYILMEYCKSVDLTHISRNPKSGYIRLVKEILYGLKDLHKSGRVHSKLAPENILVTEDGHVKITNYINFGGRHTVLKSGSRTLGARFTDKSLAYHAPELYRMENYSTILPSVDFFSFGVLLFQLLSGELPFGRLITEADWIHYQTRVKNNDWNRNILLRNEQRDMWMSILERCLPADSCDRANSVDDLIKLLPEDDCMYASVPGSKVEAPQTVLNGIMLHVMQGEEYDRCYRLPEILQAQQRLITVGRADTAVFNMIQLQESTTAYISRRHCTIELDDNGDVWYIRDGQWDKETKKKWSRSLNGTYINNQEVTEEGHKIVPGDIISIGEIKLRVEAY